MVFCCTFVDMKRILSVLLVMLGVLVVVHAVIPHHHHKDRIYLLAEENHEQHEGEESSASTCHHGNPTAEVLVCAAQNVSSSQKTTSPHIQHFLCGGFVTPCIANVDDLDCALYGNSNIPKSPFLNIRGLRAPPCFVF